MEDKPGRPTSPSAGAAGAFGPRFRSLAVLGRGGMGIVYRVYDEETATEVALKTLGTTDPDRLYRLKQEFRVLAGITHPNLVELYELIVSADDCFFTMEVVEGTTFIEHVQGPCPPSPTFGRVPLDSPTLGRWLMATEQLLLGLAALHGAGRLHRDIKPSNVLVTGT